MSQLMLVTGGAKSGKSAFAEAQLLKQKAVCYIATGVVKQPDAEMQLRIKRHQERRPSSWETIEQYRDLDEIVAKHRISSYLLDDATMMTTNLFYDDLIVELEPSIDLDQRLTEMSKQQLSQLNDHILSEWRRLLAAIKEVDQPFIIVTNEVGLGIVPATKQTRVLRDLYGEVNQLIAQSADEVFMVISGLPLKIK